MFMPTSQRDFALQVVRQLRDAGYEALWAGGCVRDTLLGLTPKDYDVATSARPEQVRELFGKRRTLAIGAAFGVIGVLGPRSHGPIEVATFRTDGRYLDGRHPENVTFSTAEHDAQRRDFTINGLFFDPVDEQVIDYVEGRRDLQQRILRAIGKPEQRFAEDKLRMLRAVRFATTLDFQIDPPTFAAIRQMATEIESVSAERIGVELRKILQHSGRAVGLQLLVDSGLLKILLPEVAAIAEEGGEPWQQILQPLEKLPTIDLPIALAALLVPLQQKKLAAELGHRFRFTNKQVSRTTWLVEHLSTVNQAANIPWPQLQRVLVHEGAEDLLLLAEAVLGEGHAGLVLSRQQQALPPEQLNPAPLVTGDDLVRHGIRPGPNFAKILQHIRDQQLEKLLATQDEALAAADRWLQEQDATSARM